MRKLSFLIFSISLLLFAACNDKYPDLEDGVYAEIITNKGTSVAKLNFKETPLTVANFVALSEGSHEGVDSIYKGKKFFNGLIFHRVIKDFMIQGGDPKGTGRGNPGYRFADEIVDSLSHSKKGILSMANSGPNTNGSQFFITLKPTKWLDGKHTVFGEIVLGQEVVDSIGVTETEKGDKPKEDVVIKEIKIHRKGSEAKAFDAPKVFEEQAKIQLEKQQKAAERKRMKDAEIKAKALKLALKDKVRFENLKSKASVKPSGLGVFFNRTGSGKKVKQGETVGIYYAGYLTDGTLFDTNILELSKETGKFDERRFKFGGYNPMPLPYSNESQTIPGFKEGVLAMKRIGDKATIFIPSALGYGERGGGPIPPNADLIFEIEFTEIIEQDNK